MSDIEQIRRAHASAKPKPSNPAWVNCHRDLGVALDEIDRLTRVDTERHAKVMELHEKHEVAKYVCNNWKERAENAESRLDKCREIERRFDASEIDDVEALCSICEVLAVEGTGPQQDFMERDDSDKYTHHAGYRGSHAVERRGNES